MALNQVYLIKSGDGLFREEDQALFGIADGNIGVGTNSPTDNFQVVGSTRLQYLNVGDKVLSLSYDNQSDLDANGGGIVLKGDSDKSITWSSARSAWTLNQNLLILSSNHIIAKQMRAISDEGLGLYEQQGIKGLIVQNNGSVNITDSLTVEDNLYIDDQLHAYGGLITTGVRSLGSNGLTFQNDEGQSSFKIEDNSNLTIYTNASINGTLSAENLISANGGIETDQINARSSAGLNLYDDGNNGLSILDGGKVESSHDFTIKGSLQVDVDSVIQNNLTVDGYIETDKLRARSDAGLLLQDDGGNGITISDGGNVEASHNVTIQGTLDVNNTLSTNAHIETDKLRARSDAGLLLQDDGGNGITISDGGNVEASHNATIQGTLGVNNTLSVNAHIETDKLRARSDAGLLLQDNGGNGITISDGGNVEASHNLKVKGNSEFNGAISYFDSNFVHVLRPESSFYKSGNGTGYIKIKLPQSWTSNFLSFDVHVYQNIGDQNSQSFTLKVGGNNETQSDSWQNVYAQLISSNTDQNFNVRFGHDGDKCAIYIGESNSSWSSPLINLYNFSASYSDGSSTADHWNDGWEVSIVSSLGAISKTSEAGLISTLLDVNSLSANNNYYITMTDLQDGKSKPFSSSALYWDSAAANLSITGGVKVGSNLVIESDGYVPWNKIKDTPFEGYALRDIVKTVSSSDFANGTLVSTDIDSSVAEGITYVIEVTGKSNDPNQPPFDWIAQGAITEGTIKNDSAVAPGGYAPEYMKVFSDSNNKLAFWWPRVSAGNSFSVHVRDAGGEWNNRVESISNSTDLSGSSTKLTTTYIKKSWTEYNDGHNSGLDADTLDALHASSFIRNDDTSDQTIPSKLTISKQLNLTQTSTTIGGTDLGNASLLVGSSEKGIGIDGNEIYASGDNLYLGVIDADDIVFRTNNGSESQSTTKAVLNSSGKFVIGRSSAVAEFSVYSGTQGFEVRPNNGSAGNGTLIEYLSRDTNNAQTGYNNHRSIAAEHKFDVNDGTALNTGLFIKSSGEVGVGTTNPLHALQVNGNIIFGDGNANSGAGFKSGRDFYLGLSSHNGDLGVDGFTGLKIKSYQDTDNSGTIDPGESEDKYNQDLEFYTHHYGEATPPLSMIIKNNGNVGIGTADPKHTLQVVGEFAVGDDSSDTGISDGIIFNSTSTSNYRHFIKHTDEGLEFSNTSSTSANRDYIFKDGRVGVGLTNPSLELEVLGDIRLTNWLRASGDLILVADDNSDNTDSSIRFMVDGVDTASNEKMRLSSSGYLGVGTTVPSNKLHIDYSVNSSIANLDEVDQISAVRFGPFRADSDTNLYIGGASGARPMLQARDSSTTGTAKDLLLNPFGGYVGIGTTTPSYKLDVDGNTRITGDLIVSGVVSVADSTSRISVSHTDSGYASHKYYLLLIKYDSNSYAAGKIIGFRQGSSEAFRFLDTYINVASTSYPEVPTDTEGTMSAFRDRTWTTGGDAFGEFSRVTFNSEYYLALEIDSGTSIHAMNWDFEGRTNASSDPNFFTIKRDDQVTYNNTHVDYKRLDSNLFSNQSGFLGVGYSSPASILDVKADGSNNIYRATDTNNYYRWRIDQSYNMYFSDANQADKSIFKNDGRVGLGTTSPWAPLTITKTYEDYATDVSNEDIAIALDQNQSGRGIGLRFKTSSLYYQNLIDSSGTLHWKNYDGSSYRSRLLLTQQGALSLGTPGNGQNAYGRFLSFEGNTDSTGEASSRIFFTEHNSTTGNQDAYGISIAYRGGGSSITSSSGSNWTGLTQIGNGEWAMFGHNASNDGAVIMKGDRAGTYIHQNANVTVEGEAKATSFKTNSWTISQDSNGDLIFSYE